MKIITIHGIRAKKQWFRTLDTFEEFSGEKYQLDHFTYNYFDLLSFLLWFRRRAVYDRFIQFYLSKTSGTEVPCAICHSFGTYILLTAIMRYAEVRFDKVILFGSILNPDMDLAVFFAKDQVRELLHEVGRKDRCVRFSKIVLGKKSGNSGEVGFSDIPSRYLKRIRQIEYGEWGHGSATFHPHIKQVWIPFLTAPRFKFKASILRDDVVRWAYSAEADRRLKYDTVEYCARIDKLGNYYGQYSFTCLNCGTEPISSTDICITGDSTDTVSGMSLSVYDEKLKKLDHEVRLDEHHHKQLIVHFTTPVPAGGRIAYRYRFRFSGTMRYEGDTDTFRTYGCARLRVSFNSHYRLRNVCFFAMQNKTIVSRHEPLTDVKEELDGSFTYDLELDNREKKYDVVILYFEGHQGEGKRAYKGVAYEIQEGPLVIRRATDSDIKRVYSIEANIERGNAASEAVLQERHRMFPDGFLVAVEDGKVVGYIESLLWDPPEFRSFNEICDFPIHHRISGETMYVIFIGVSNTHRRRGIGSKLIAAAEQVAIEYSCKIAMLVAKNELEAFYAKRGYGRDTELPYFLETDEKPSVVMRKSLTKRCS